MEKALDSIIDTHVGSQIALRRREMGMSQSALAATMGITFQQLQKYEKAVNRISASKLWLAARTLDRPVAYFFPGVSVQGDPVID